MPGAAIAPYPTTPPLLVRGFSACAAATLVFFAALWFVLCRHLSGEWSVNEQYNYGWFVPFFALFLFWLRREDRPEPEIRAQRTEARTQSEESRISNFQCRMSAVAVAICCLLLLLPLRLFEIGNPDWRPLGWVHAAVVATLTLLYIWYRGGATWLRHFAFPIGFFFVAVPWVTPIEAPVIQGLMRVIAALASETANLFGIPARLEGNLIRVSSGFVGVNEACSGVRSLQTALMIGLLFGEVKRLSISRRIALLFAAAAIAFVGNYARAFFLVWIAATQHVSAIDHWHDFAGYSIVAAVFVGSLGLAAWLGRGPSSPKPPPQSRFGVPWATAWQAPSSAKPPAWQEEVRNQRSEIRRQRPEIRRDRTHEIDSNLEFPRFSFLICALVWLVAVEVGSIWWYGAHERNLVVSTPWTVHWPESAPDFHLLKLDEEVRRTLRFDEGEAASWNCPSIESVETINQVTSPRITCFAYFFRWKPGRNSALLANLHRPDVCLPAVGWEQVADNGVRHYSAAASFVLPFRYFEFRHGTKEDPAQQIAHAFYCLWEDRAPPGTVAASRLPQMTTSPSSWTRGERVRAVLEGRRHLGQQVMEIVLRTRGVIDQNEAQADFAALLPKMIVVTPELH
jgi:exosortase